MKNIPKYIYLQVADDSVSKHELDETDFEDLKHSGEVTWCWHRIHDNDLEFKLIKNKRRNSHSKP